MIWPKHETLKGQVAESSRFTVEGLRHSARGAPKGFTLLEALLALSILGIVLLAYIGLQATSLKALQGGQATQALAREAENFLVYLRANPTAIPGRCREDIPLGPARAACTFVPCRAEADGSLACAGVNPKEAQAFQILLEVPRERPRLRLETVVYQP
ncbi:prepilin [Thermus sp. LT1-2-5]|uniref:type IV pilus modification PilV family protein n=1 Tax=Thermus sp. LT1-2-5 TaxID=3026935 RepID=UPI0030EA27FB